MLNTIKEYRELCSSLQGRTLELLVEKDQTAAGEEIREILNIMQAERPQVKYELYKEHKDTYTFEKVETIEGLYYEGIILFEKVKEMTAAEFDIILQRDKTGDTANTQGYVINGEHYTLTFSSRNNMQTVFEAWSKNLKTNLDITSSTGTAHHVEYNKDFERATFN